MDTWILCGYSSSAVCGYCIQPRCCMRILHTAQELSTYSGYCLRIQGGLWRAAEGRIAWWAVCAKAMQIIMSPILSRLVSPRLPSPPSSLPSHLLNIVAHLVEPEMPSAFRMIDTLGMMALECTTLKSHTAQMCLSDVSYAAWDPV